MCRPNYPRNWKKVSKIIRRLANGRCEWCGCETNELSTHHIGTPYADGTPGDSHDKHDLRRENLAALCWPCHRDADQLYPIDPTSPKYLAMRRYKENKRLRKQLKREAHQALGIGTGLLVREEKAA
jgi:5-methylcytosine-specific restriction endonuclease McrA